MSLTSGEDISHLLGKSTTQHLQNKSVLSKIEVKYLSLYHKSFISSTKLLEEFRC